MDFKKYIAEIPDFPKPGVLFYDITPLMAAPEVYAWVIKEFAREIAKTNPTKVIAAEARGFFFGPAIALELGLPFIPIRKKGKLPRKTIGAQYALEYGTDSLYMHSDDVDKNDRVVILDDILATGGTAGAMCELAEICGAQIACCAFFMELEFLRGRNKLGSRHVITLVKK